MQPGGFGQTETESFRCVLLDLTSVVKTGKITIPGFVNTLVYVLVKCSTGDTGSGSNTGEMVDGGLQYMCGPC